MPPQGIYVLIAAAAIVAAGQLAMTHAHRELSVARGSAIQMLVPIATGIGSYLFFRETFTPKEILGAALTLVATWQVVRSPATRQIA